MDQGGACPCIAIFSDAENPGKEFVDRCTSKDESGDCQQHSVSEYSPGPVDDDELLLRQVHVPTHTKAGIACIRISETLFDDAFTRGASISRALQDIDDCYRAVHAAGEERARRIREGVNGKQPAPNRQYLGAIALLASEIRQLRHMPLNRDRRVRIYDTGKKDDVVHADIMVYKVDAKNKLERNALRKDLAMQMYNLARRRKFNCSPEFSQTDLLDTDFFGDT